jgi:hypothetical protein
MAFTRRMARRGNGIDGAMGAFGISILAKFQLDSRNGRRKIAIAIFRRR